MKRTMMVFTMKTDDGREIAVHADNSIEAFDKMRLAFPKETTGKSYTDLETRKGWKEC